VHVPVHPDERLFANVRIDDTDRAHVVEVLSLLGKDAVGEDGLHTYFVNAQVHAGLVALFAGPEPSDGLVGLLAGSLKTVTADDARAGLRRVRATFDFPVVPTSVGPLQNLPKAKQSAAAAVPMPIPVTLPVPAQPGPVAPPVTAPQGTPSSSGSTGSSGKPAVSRAEKNLKIKDLMDAGLIAPGVVIYASWRGAQRQAHLYPDGSVEYLGTKYGSVSSAGTAMKYEIAGSDLPESTAATDGWQHWKVTDAKGRIITLKELRQRHAADRTSTSK